MADFDKMLLNAYVRVCKFVDFFVWRKLNPDATHEQIVHTRRSLGQKYRSYDE